MTPSFFPSIKNASPYAAAIPANIYRHFAFQCTSFSCMTGFCFMILFDIIFSSLFNYFFSFLLCRIYYKEEKFCEHVVQMFLVLCYSSTHSAILSSFSPLSFLIFFPSSASACICFNSVICVSISPSFHASYI